MMNSNYKIDMLQEHLFNTKSMEIEREIIENGECYKLIKNLADSLFEEGNYLRALSCYVKLLAYEPKNARVWNKLAIIFIKLENFTSAIEMSRIAYRFINQDNGC